MVYAQVGWATAVAVVSMLGQFLQGTSQFSPTACQSFEPFMNQYLVGQEPSLRVLTDAICDHISGLGGQAQGFQGQKKPLVISVHGPPGVGKSYFHQLAAQVLYNGENANKVQGQHCPGRHCAGYKVLFGMDYTTHDRDEQHAMLQKALLDHVSLHPQSFIVVEEYDKLDCYMRGFFRQILQGGKVGNQSLGDSVVLLESNLGFSTLHRMLEDVPSGQREDIDMDGVQRALKNMVFTMWQKQKCEGFSDSQKLLRNIDFFLPFYPLEKKHIEKLFAMRLDSFAETALSHGAVLTYNTSLVDFLANRVEFDGRYPIEGGKEVNTVTTGYLSRPFRLFLQSLEDSKEKNHAGDTHPSSYRWVVQQNKMVDILLNS
ncbi:Torsin-1A [Picochlorum sp. SENEW3]|nr:Torsin-1A [Picochlorum sp. SENEW3]